MSKPENVGEALKRYNYLKQKEFRSEKHEKEFLKLSKLLVDIVNSPTSIHHPKTALKVKELLDYANSIQLSVRALKASLVNPGFINAQNYMSVPQILEQIALDTNNALKTPIIQEVKDSYAYKNNRKYKAENHKYTERG